MESSSLIETGVDKLVNLVKGRGKIALSDAAKELGVSTAVIQEWVDFLEEEGIISVEYSLTKPFLVDRRMTKKEVEEKSKEFTTKKDVFVRKAEVNLSFLEKQADYLKEVKTEFDKLKGELGFKLDSVRDELKELEKFQQMKLQLQKELEDQKNESTVLLLRPSFPHLESRPSKEERWQTLERDKPISPIFDNQFVYPELKPRILLPNKSIAFE